MAEETPNFPKIRRVVTGHDANNIAKVILDGPATNEKYNGRGGVSTLIWSSDEMPMDMAAGEAVEDMGARKLGTPPPENGTRFCVIDFPPGAPGRMHRTETVDYVIVLLGELEMDMDNSTVKLSAGDILIQRGTNHSWRNPSDKPARAAFVLIDAKPLGIGAPILRGSHAH